MTAVGWNCGQREPLRCLHHHGPHLPGGSALRT